jgi:hypothetical protein
LVIVDLFVDFDIGGAGVCPIKKPEKETRSRDGDTGCFTG